MSREINSIKVRLGISSCLLGQRVRYDGNHKRDDYITDTLARYFEFVPVCPEVGIGLGVPRPPIRLVGSVARPRAVGVDDSTLDVTDALAAYGRRQARMLDDISGYIFKSKSPSCGLARVKVYGRGAAAPRLGAGVYAAAFRAAQALLPVEEEGRLNDAALRDNFLERVFAYRRWRQLQASGVSAARLIAFHTAHKLALMAHGPSRYAALGRVVAGADRRGARAVAARYIDGFMCVLSYPATRRMHANVLQHAAGYLKRDLDAGDRHELRDAIESYRTGALPLLVPVTLLRHHFRRYPNPWIEDQVYLYPHSAEFTLRYGI